MERSSKPKVSKSEFILFSQMLCGITTHLQWLGALTVKEGNQQVFLEQYS